MVTVSYLPYHSPATLEFSDLSYLVRGQDPSAEKVGCSIKPCITNQMKPILKNISGCFKPGELTAILGPSGAGKSTLLNILAGYKISNVEGCISVNGKPRDLSEFRKMSCYIMQEHTLLPNLTVAEAMNFAAEFKLPASMSRKRKNLVISETLELLGLTECKEVLTSKISGGQRKRLAIAQELVSNPPIMFFDEPTSGLDSASCYSCIALLKALSQGGRTIIATIHQPSARILELFDAIYVLGSGQCLYRGGIRPMVPFLAKQGLLCPAYHNPADFVIDIAAGEFGDEWIPLLSKAVALCSDSRSSGLANDSSSDSGGDMEDEFDNQSNNAEATYKFSKRENQSQDAIPKAGSDSKDVVVSLLSPQMEHMEEEFFKNDRISIILQFFLLLQRSFICIWRDPMSTTIRFFATIAVAIFMGIVFKAAGNDGDQAFNNVAGIFFAVMFQIFGAMMTVVVSFPIEREVLIREHLNRWYSLKAYYLARSLADLPLQLFFPCLFIAIFYYLTEQLNDPFRFCLFVTMNILIALVAQGFGLLVSACCDIQSAVFVAPIAAIPFFIFSGFFVSTERIPMYIKWVDYISYPRYGFQGALTAIYGYDRQDLDCFQAYCHFKRPSKVLEFMKCNDVDILVNITWLVGIMLAFRIMAYIALRIRVYLSKR